MASDKRAVRELLDNIDAVDEAIVAQMRSALRFRFYEAKYTNQVKRFDDFARAYPWMRTDPNQRKIFGEMASGHRESIKKCWDLIYEFEAVRETMLTELGRYLIQ